MVVKQVADFSQDSDMSQRPQSGARLFRYSSSKKPNLFLLSAGLILGINLLGAVTTHGQRRQKVLKRSANLASCLPPNINLKQVSAYRPGNITIAEKLTELKARCWKGRIVGSNNKEIRFFRPQCWGNPPADYRMIRKRESEELEKLKKRYSVIVFECNPMIQ